uniref:prefoldin subunit 3-like n=1 Tax=Styela clava TaxID=7725 RepID=UPI00193AA458|nr:prefoldin subunit 3-like [Styela clava]
MATETKKAHLGIPEAEFVEDVDKFMAEEPDSSAQGALKKLEERYQKYKMMEMSLNHKKEKLKNQIPEIKTTLDIVKHLNDIKDKDESMETHFLLSGSLRAKATIPPTKDVCLWLGANVMLNYSVEDAYDLLNNNLKTAVKNLDSVNDDLDYLRDQCTTTEVSMARVYNWDVLKRKSLNQGTVTAK